MQSLNKRHEFHYSELTDDELVLSYKLLITRDIPIPLDLSIELGNRGIIIEELSESI